MSVTASLLIALSTGSLCSTWPESVPAVPETENEELRELYESGTEFPVFLENADRRKALWEANYGSGTLRDEALARARALAGQWHILAIAVDGCSDSVNTIPYVALLTESVPNLNMRIVDSTAGRSLMEGRPTPDGRAATPTLIVLDESFEEVGCWIERPSPLQEWALSEGSDLEPRDYMREKMSWYREDGGATTVSELVGIMEAASRGERICGA